MTAKVVPAAGWVRVNAAVNGIPAGENCRLLVVSRDGTREIAAGWIVSEKGETDGTTLDGSAAVDPADVVAVEVQNTEGRTFVTLPCNPALTNVDVCGKLSQRARGRSRNVRDSY
ncbi:hypothetical protein [Phytohabitans rumicis]|nr:hypothetical protein [Phytohabitans rumicis]